MNIYLSLACAVIGVLIYALTDGKLSRIGEIMYGCGLLALLLMVGGKMV